MPLILVVFLPIIIIPGLSSLETPVYCINSLYLSQKAGSIYFWKLF